MNHLAVYLKHYKSTILLLLFTQSYTTVQPQRLQYARLPVPHYLPECAQTYVH